MSARPSPSKAPTRWAPWRWGQWLALVGGLALGVAALLGWQMWSSYQSFLRAAGTDDQSLRRLWRQAQTSTPAQTDGRVTALLLGTDTLEYRDASWPLTDTIMLASLELASGQINLLSLPRDLYIDERGTRINAIYPSFYAEATASAGPRTAAYLSQLLDVPIDYTLVVSLADVADFLDLIGGVDVEVKTSFTDTRYPRSGVDITRVFDPELLYETVVFEAGPTHLDSTRALQFMRSRHAQNSEGSDFARAARQQQVLTAVSDKITRQLWSDLRGYDLSLLGKFYQFYTTHFADQVPFGDGLAVIVQLLRLGHLPRVASSSLDIDTPGGIIGENKTDYTLHVRDWPALRREVKSLLTTSDVK